MKCDCCGSFQLERHCDSPTCPWMKCSRRECQGVGYPGKHMRQSRDAEQRRRRLKGQP